MVSVNPIPIPVPLLAPRPKAAADTDGARLVWAGRGAARIGIAGGGSGAYIPPAALGSRAAAVVPGQLSAGG